MKFLIKNKINIKEKINPMVNNRKYYYIIYNKI